MKLLTLNCHSWQEEDQFKKIKILARTIKEMEYDVIALQEVSQLKSSKILYDNIREDNFAEVLLRELKDVDVNDYSFIWDFSHIGFDRYEEGLAIFTKHTIEDYCTFYVSKDTSENNYKSRKVIKATINVDDNEFDFYNCHLGWWNDDEEPFKYQVEKLLQHISYKNTNIIMGDFNNNAFIRNEGYDYLIGKGLIDTYSIAVEKDKGVTVRGTIDGWEKSAESKRLDLILLTKRLEVLSSKVLFNTKDSLVSDHFAVEVNIK